MTVAINGLDRPRSVLVHPPKTYTGDRRLPLVLNLHGSGSSASQQERFSGMDATADDDGFIVAYPQAVIASGSGDDWNVPGQPLFGGVRLPANAPDDVAYVARTITVLEEMYCVDPARVYATGFSGGARMVSQLACTLSTTIAAVAPVSGLRFPDTCSAQRAVPIVSFHGTADPIDPFYGNGQAYWTYSVPDAASRWAEHEACRGSAAEQPYAASVTLFDYPGCNGGAAVELYAIAGEGHEWPGGPPLPAVYTSLLGPQSNAIDANTVMLAFFTAYHLH